MNGNRVLVILLAANLFATLLVYRGLEVLVDRVDRMHCADGAAVAKPNSALPKHPVQVAPKPAAVPSRSMSSFQDMSDSVAQSQPDIDAASADDIDLIKDRYVSETGDAEWTSRMHEAIQTVANASVNYSGITQDLIECKATVCKLVLGYADRAVFDAFVSELTMALKGDLAATLYFDTVRTVGGNSTVDVYLVRE